MKGKKMNDDFLTGYITGVTVMGVIYILSNLI